MNCSYLKISLAAISNLLLVIQIIVPIVLIVMLGYHFIVGSSNPDNKKLNNKIKNSVMALIIIFLIPTI